MSQPNDPPTPSPNKGPSGRSVLLIAVVSALLGALATAAIFGLGYYDRYKSHYTQANALEVINNSIEGLFASGDPYDRMPELERNYGKEKLRSMAMAGGDWILSMQRGKGKNDGRFLYKFDPKKKRPPRGFRSDNFLRQAGTVYSLILLYETSGEKRYLDAAEKGMGYLLTRLVQDERDPGRAYFQFKKHAKLGGSALPMLSLVKLKKILDTDRYDDVIEKVGAFLLFMLKEDGEFQSFYVYSGHSYLESETWTERVGKKMEWDSNIYPGEAILALSRLYGLTGEAKYLKAVQRAHHFYGESTRRWRNAAFIPWTTTGMVEMYEMTGDERFKELAFRMSDHIVDSIQNLKPSLDHFGSFHSKPSVNTATYLEGVLDAYRLAKHEGDEDRMRLYRLSALAGYRFLDTLQFDEAKAAPYAEYKEYLLGGFYSTPEDLMVRIDNTQHSVSAIVKGIAYLWDDPPRLAPVNPPR